jgi:hypothetical protein
MLWKRAINTRVGAINHSATSAHALGVLMFSVRADYIDDSVSVVVHDEKGCQQVLDEKVDLTGRLGEMSILHLENYWIFQGLNKRFKTQMKKKTPIESSSTGERGDTTKNYNASTLMPIVIAPRRALLLGRATVRLT